MASVPTIFVSSTCYDLQQVRADLKDFIESLGLQPIMSDYNSFPVEPEINAIENCLKVVDEFADLFVLVVGGRYGSANDQGKSVTNMEYLRARAKGIPVYGFVQKSILNILPVWKKNPGGDFTTIVDSTKLFEFITTLRDSEGVWVFPFEVAQEITDTLRRQLAHLFLKSLQIRKRFKTTGLPESLAKLQGAPLRLVIDRPIIWEHRLFSEVLSQEIARAKQEKLDLRYRTALGPGQHFDNFEVFGWLRKKSGQLGRLITNMDRVVNVALQDALGPPGVPGDPEAIVYVGKKLGGAYKEAIQWTLDFQQVDVDQEFQNLVDLTSTMASNMINEIEAFSEHFRTELDEVLANLPKPGEQRVLEFSLKLTIPDMDELHSEIERINRDYGFSD